MRKWVTSVYLPVCLSICYTLVLEITDNCWFRYELTQDEYLGPFIVLLFVGNAAFKIPFTIMISAELLTVINFCRCVLVSCSCACVLFIVLCVGNLNISLMASWLCLVQGTKCLKEGKKQIIIFLGQHRGLFYLALLLQLLTQAFCSLTDYSLSIRKLEKLLRQVYCT